jgi:hypothetical protein
MQCPGCASYGGNGLVPAFDGSGDAVSCPLCTPYGTPGIYPGAGAWGPIEIEASLTNQAATPITISIKTSHDFLWQAAIATRTGIFNTLIDINGIQIQTVYNQAGTIIGSQGLKDTNFWGTNANPFPLFTPIPLLADDKVTFTLTDTSGANGGAPNVISLLLVGALFPAGSLHSPFSQGQSGPGGMSQ